MGIDFEGLNGFDNIDYSASRANADILRFGVEVVSYGADGSIALGSFNIGHCEIERKT